MIKKIKKKEHVNVIWTFIEDMSNFFNIKIIGRTLPFHPKITSLRRRRWPLNPLWTNQEVWQLEECGKGEMTCLVKFVTRRIEKPEEKRYVGEWRREELKRWLRRKERDECYGWMQKRKRLLIHRSDRQRMQIHAVFYLKKLWK